MNNIKVELQEVFGSDRTIAEAAWTSSTNHQKHAARTEYEVRKLTARLAEEGHGTPFEHVVLRYWLKIPVFVSRQLVKHRAGVSWNEMSGRYRTIPGEYYMPADLDDETNGYYDICEVAVSYYEAQMRLYKEQKQQGKITNEQYKRQREIVRGVLPQSMLTEVSLTINLRALIHMAQLRISGDAQLETCYVVQQMIAAAAATGKINAALEAYGYGSSAP